MYTKLLWSVVLSFLVSAPVWAEDKPSYACAFENPLIFGASISAGYGSPADALGAMNNPNHIPSRISPVEKLARFLVDDPKVINIAEMTNSMRLRASGPRQMAYFINTASDDQLNSVSVFASVDGFYWPAAFPERGCPGVADDVEKMVDYVEGVGKPLILANVPKEDRLRVSPLLLLTRSWFQNGDQCLKDINKAMVDYCLPSPNCYLIDFHTTVADLNNPEKGVKFQGGTWFSRTIEEVSALPPGSEMSDMRFDGVHLNDLGTDYIVELIENAFKAKSPACAK